MPRKGMRNVCFSSKSKASTSSSDSVSSPSRFGFSPRRPSFSESVMNRTLELAESKITKWNPETSTFGKVTSLFHENRGEAKDFIICVNNLQKAMHLLVTENPTSDKLVRSQNLMQIAMKRLQKEFYLILSMNRAHLDPESVSTRSSSSISLQSDYDDDDHDDNDQAEVSIAQVEDVSSLAMADLRLIAECMISSGYAKECVKIYKIIRKSIIDESIFRLGVEKLSSSHVQKMDWEVLDIRINNWLEAVNIALKTLFNGERILSDHVFAVSESIRESCFTDISKEGAMTLFGFPENVVRNSKKKSPEKVFRMLDMYTAIASHWQEIESIFSSESSLTVRSQTITSLIKIGEYVRTALEEFESMIQKEKSKSTVVAGGGIHHLTIDSMNYLSLLADYSNVLSDILADSAPPAATSLPELYSGFSDSDESPAATMSRRLAWLILLLLAKLDGKAKLYRDVSLSYLFLANNLQYVLVKVRTSNLKYLLGDEWLSKHEVKVKQLAANYERLAWGHVKESLPEDQAVTMSLEEARECFKRFNASFEQAHRKQSVCVIPDSKLREDIKANLARKILPVYRELHNNHKAMMGGERNFGSLVRFTPQDVGHHLSDLFFGNAGSGSGSSSSSNQSSSHSRPSL